MYCFHEHPKRAAGSSPGSSERLCSNCRTRPPCSSCDKKCVSLHQVASDDVKRLEENKVLSQGSGTFGTTEEIQGGPAWVSSGDYVPQLCQTSRCQACHTFGDCLFSGLTVLWMCPSKQRPCLECTISCLPSPALRKSGTGIHSMLSTWEVWKPEDLKVIL